jgi:hypothetical protein
MAVDTGADVLVIVMPRRREQHADSVTRCAVT